MCTASSPSAAPSSSSTIPALPPAICNEQADGINSAGTIIVGTYARGSDVHHGFIYNGPLNVIATGDFITLDDTSAGTGGGQGTFAVGIDAAGHVVGNYLDSSSQFFGFTCYNGPLDTIASGDFITLSDPHGVRATHVTGIDNFGDIVGYYYDGNSQAHGFTYTGSFTSINGSAFTTLDDPFGVNGTFITGVNNIGDIVGTYLDANFDLHGFIDKNGIFINLDSPAALDGTNVTGINRADTVVGYFTDTNNDDNTDGFTLQAPTTLVLSNGSALNSGSTLTIDPASVLVVEAHPGSGSNTLDGVSVTNNGGIDVDPTTSGAVLTLDDGTTITGGTLQIGGEGALDVSFGNGVADAATLDGVSVANAGIIDVDPSMSRS